MLTALWWLACTSEVSDDTDPTTKTTTMPKGCDEGNLEATVGTGVTAYESLEAGADVTMVFGPQGGWHIDVGVRIVGAGPDVQILPSVTRVSDGLVLAGDQAPSFLALAAYDPGTCTGDALGVRAFLDDADAGDQTYVEFICSLDGAEVELAVDVSDFGTRSTTDQLTVTARTDVNQECP